MTSDVIHRADGSRRTFDPPPGLPHRPEIPAATAAAMNAAMSGLARRAKALAPLEPGTLRGSLADDSPAAAQPRETVPGSGMRLADVLTGPHHPFVAPPDDDPDATIVIGRHRADGTTDTVTRHRGAGPVTGRTGRGGWFARAVAAVTGRTLGGGA